MGIKKKKSQKKRSKQPSFIGSKKPSFIESPDQSSSIQQLQVQSNSVPVQNTLQSNPKISNILMNKNNILLSNIPNETIELKSSSNNQDKNSNNINVNKIKIDDIIQDDDMIQDLNSQNSKSFMNIKDSKIPLNSIPLETNQSQIASNYAKNSRSTIKSKYPVQIISPINSKSHKNKNISLQLNTLNNELPSFLLSNRSNVNTGNNSILPFSEPNNYDVNNTGNNVLPSFLIPKNKNQHSTKNITKQQMFPSNRFQNLDIYSDNDNIQSDFWPVPYATPNIQSDQKLNDEIDENKDLIQTDLFQEFEKNRNQKQQEMKLFSQKIKKDYIIYGKKYQKYAQDSNNLYK